MSLIVDVADLKKYLGGIQKNLNAATIMPYVEAAELKYLLVVFGPEQYEHMGLEPVGEKDEKLLELTKRSLAHYAVLEAMPFLNLAIGDLGIHETSTTNSAPARQWNYANLELAVSNNGDAFLDMALTFLEKNADFFPVWAGAEACTLSRGLIINSTEELAKYVQIGGSRRAYLVLRNYLSRAEFMYIRPALGVDFYDELKAALVSGTLSVAQQKLLGKLKGAVAHLAMYEAIPEISLNISGSGIRVVNDNDGVRARLQANPKDLAILRERMLHLGQMYLTDTKSFLNATAESDYPTYFESDLYPKPEDDSGPRGLIDNADSAAFVV